jgi:protein-L-isoaspartate(D-aspartate) O-methyltransferase
VFTGLGYIDTPSDDPAFLYQDIVVALDEERRINNGQPSLHAYSLAALNLKESETVLHIGAGTGYYTAVLAELAGETGKVVAFEVSASLAERAAASLADRSNVIVHAQSGATETLPACDAIYVSAGATAPLGSWLDALCPGGRLLFPLTPDGAGELPGAGGMLLVTRVTDERLDARFLCPVMFTPCVGARDPDTAKKLADAFKRGDSANVRSLRRGTTPDESCWCAGSGWWLSTSASS